MRCFEEESPAFISLTGVETGCADHLPACEAAQTASPVSALSKFKYRHKTTGKNTPNGILTECANEAGWCGWILTDIS